MKTACLLLAIGFATYGLQTPPTPSASERRAIQQKLSDLWTRVDGLRGKGADPTWIADVDIFRKAAEYIIRFPEEFASHAFVADTLAVLDTGLTRARELEAGTPSWPKRRARWFARTCREWTAACSRTR